MKKKPFLQLISSLISFVILCSAIFFSCGNCLYTDAAQAGSLSAVTCRYQDRVVKLADFLLDLQNKNGAIPDCADADTVNTDSNMEYALIGLGAAYQLTADRKYLISFQKGIDWLAAAQCMTDDTWKGSWWYTYDLNGKHLPYTEDTDILDIRGVDTTSALFVYLLYLNQKLDPSSSLSTRYRDHADAALHFIQQHNLDTDHLSRSSWQQNAAGKWNLYTCKYCADQGDVYLGFRAAGELFHSAQYRKLADEIKKSTESAFFNQKLGRYCVSIEDGRQNHTLNSFEPIQSQGFLPWVWGSDTINHTAASWLSGKLRPDGNVVCYPEDPSYAMSIALLGMAENAASGKQPAAAYEWLNTHLTDKKTGGIQDSTASAEEDCNVAGFCLIALTRMLPFEPYRIYGVTLDDVTSVSISEVTQALDAMDRKPTVRIVMKPECSASSYVSVLQALHGHAFIMLCPCDSSYLKHYQSAAAYVARFRECVGALSPYVDIWEAGNEINGEGWTGLTPRRASQYLYAAWHYLHAKNLVTEITPYDFRHGDQSIDMIPWLEKYVPDQMKKQVDHVLISYYDDDNGGIHNDWQTTFDQLKTLFPNARIGFGECGFSAPHSYDSAFRKQVRTYYGMPACNDRYEGGCFWWYWQEDCIPWRNHPAWDCINRECCG